MTRLAIATCLDIPEPDVDEDLLLDSLRAAGIDTHLTAWDDPTVQWNDFAAVVIRSTWNYVQHLDEFLMWTRLVARESRLFNPAEIIEWNCHKLYLDELKDRGLPVVPTAWVDKGDPVRLADVMRDNGWTDVVAKPTVGAGSFLTDRVRATDPVGGEDFWRRLVSSRDAMVQPYLESVEEYGERSIMWIDGELTHAIRKDPRLGDAEESVSGALPIAADEQTLAEEVLADLDDLLYARVDLIRDDTGVPLIAEIELVEPSLFLLQSPPALDRLVSAISKRI